MNETEAAQQIRDGLLPSPYKFGGMTLFALRVTGTGLSYRSGIDEHVWRDASHYLNEDFLARVPGLPILWEHPEKGMLNSKEFENRIIGTAMLPYIKGDEVWAVCRLYDEEAVRLMTDGQLSTSPGVSFKPTDGNVTQEVGGVSILIEGIPSNLDHLSVCGLGVWDKNGPPAGVQNDLLPETDDSAKEPTMAEETEAEKTAREEKDKADAARRDAGTTAVMDAVEGLARRLDAMEKDRKDAAEAAEKDNKDAARRDAQARRDAEREEWRKADAEGCARDDARELAECDAMKKDGMDEYGAMDKARSDRRDRMDARRKDAEKAEQDRKDAEKRDADARKDSAGEIARAVEAALAKRTRSDSDSEAIAAEQARADVAHVAFGGRAPAPMLGETTPDYQIRMARGFQKHSTRWKDTNIGTLDAATRAVVIEDIYNDAIAASKSDEHLPVGKLTAFRRTNESGHQITEFRGRDSIFKTLSAPVMAVTQFKTEKRA
jgi:colicin import membrane protein